MLPSCNMSFDLGVVAPRNPVERAEWFEKYEIEQRVQLPKRFMAQLEAPHTVWAKTHMYSLDGTIDVYGDTCLKMRLSNYAVEWLRQNPSNVTVTIDVSEAINQYVQELADAVEATRQKDEADNLEHARIVDLIGQLSFDDVLNADGGWTPTGCGAGLSFSPRVVEDERLAAYLADNSGFCLSHLDRFLVERNRRREAARCRHEDSLAKMAADVRAWVLAEAQNLPSNIVRAAASGRDVTTEVIKHCQSLALVELHGWMPVGTEVLTAPQNIEIDRKRIPTQAAYVVLDEVNAHADSVLSALLLPGATLSCTDSDFARVNIGESKYSWRSCLQVQIEHPWDYKCRLLSFYVLLEPINS